MRLLDADPGDNVGVQRPDDSQPTPQDATKATAEQREEQRELDHQNDDPAAPGSSQDHTKIADET